MGVHEEEEQGGEEDRIEEGRRKRERREEERREEESNEGEGERLWQREEGVEEGTAQEKKAEKNLKEILSKETYYTFQKDLLTEEERKVQHFWKTQADREIWREKERERERESETEREIWREKERERERESETERGRIHLISIMEQEEQRELALGLRTSSRVSKSSILQAQILNSSQFPSKFPLYKDNMY
jgi:hypothetical protein